MIKGTKLGGRRRRIKAERFWMEARQWARKQGLEENCHVAGGLPL